MAGPSTSGQGEQLGELDTTKRSCFHLDGGCEQSGPPRLRYIKGKYGEAYKELEDIREEVVGRYVRAVMREGFKPTKKYVSDVFVYKDAQQRKRMLRRLDDSTGGYPGTILMWVDEGDHIHVIHDCPFSNGQCRCFFSKTEDFRRDVRGPMRRLRYITEMDELDWSNVFLYFVLSKWESNSQVWINGRLQREPHRDEIIQWENMCRRSREILEGEDERVRYHSGLEDGHHEDSGSVVQAGALQTRKKRSADGDSGLPSKKTKLSAFQKTVEQVQSLLGEYFVMPPVNLRNVIVNTEDTLDLYDPKNQNNYIAACKYVQSKIVKLKFSDFRRLYDGKRPVFYANNVDPFDYYHDIPTSTDIIVQLLRLQFNDDDDKVREFLTNVRDWFNLLGWEGNSKIQAICIVGAANSGKSFFFDMLACLAYNTGTIGKVNNKHNKFSFQEIVNRRFIIANELSMEDSAIDDFKKLCEGAAFNFSVKYESDGIHTKTPVCIISNRLLEICFHPDFKDVRLKTMHWKKAAFLAEFKKKAYPLAIFNVFDYYNIEI